ncbi:MAG: VanW family protein [bacterium]
MNKLYIIFTLCLILLFGSIYWLESNNPTKDELGGYSTTLSGRSDEQIININLAAQALDKIFIAPGEVFSFNERVGPYTVAKGYRDAPQIYYGKLIKSIGGGICQVSSTLYNAALLSNMKIVERKPHNTYVKSVPPGRDASVALSQTYEADLKFRNTSNAPVKIVTDTSNKRLNIRIMGTRFDTEKVDIATESPDPSSVNVYRIITKTGGQKLRELVSKDKYFKEGLI